jgi:hypothetical protein
VGEVSKYCWIDKAVGKKLSHVKEAYAAVLLVWDDGTYTVLEAEGDEDDCVLTDQYGLSASSLVNSFGAALCLNAGIVTQEDVDSIEAEKRRRVEAQAEARRLQYEQLKKEFEGEAG